jgi:hypothetical protein
VDLLHEGGFRLCQFVSNSSEFLEHIDESERTVKDLDFSSKGSTMQRTLGLKWDIKDDTFELKSKPKESPATKRGVLSVDT